MEIVHIMLQTLIEMCVANIDNQEVIYDSRVIIDVLNGILQIRFYKDKKLDVDKDNERDVDYIKDVSDILYYNYTKLCSVIYSTSKYFM